MPTLATGASARATCVAEINLLDDELAVRPHRAATVSIDRCILYRTKVVGNGEKEEGKVVGRVRKSNSARRRTLRVRLRRRLLHTRDHLLLNATTTAFTVFRVALSLSTPFYLQRAGRLSRSFPSIYQTNICGCSALQWQVNARTTSSPPRNCLDERRRSGRLRQRGQYRCNLLPRRDPCQRQLKRPILKLVHLEQFISIVSLLSFFEAHSVSPPYDQHSYLGH